jgi:hypothetical protein
MEKKFITPNAYVMSFLVVFLAKFCHFLGPKFCNFFFYCKLEFFWANFCQIFNITKLGGEKKKTWL